MSTGYNTLITIYISFHLRLYCLFMSRRQGLCSQARLAAHSIHSFQDGPRQHRQAPKFYSTTKLQAGEAARTRASFDREREELALTEHHNLSHMDSSGVSCDSCKAYEELCCPLQTRNTFHDVPVHSLGLIIIVVSSRESVCLISKVHVLSTM